MYILKLIAVGFLGYATDLVVCVALGVDMFDCVFPTRTGNFEEEGWCADVLVADFSLPILKMHTQVALAMRSHHTAPFHFVKVATPTTIVPSIPSANASPAAHAPAAT